jgi:hypothetical protein
MEGPIRVKELGDMAPEMPATQTVQNQTDYLPRLFWDLIFVSKESNEYQS